MTSKDYTRWRLRSGSDRRFRAGHPWVYSNELAESPKGLPPGAPVELVDETGKFLARGYGNPHSLISFRALSRDPEAGDPLSDDSLVEALSSAHRLRVLAGLGDASHRLCFGEADFLPGLVIDRFLLSSGQQVFVAQLHTAGMDRLAARLPELLEKFVARTGAAGGPDWAKTAIVLRNDLSVRKLEGLQEEKPRVLREVPGLTLSAVTLKVAGGAEFDADLLEGQKTGFFLDQAWNVELASRRLARLRPAKAGPLRILDLCCYVGQWGTQLARTFLAQGVAVDVTAVDSSAQALALAKRNIERAGASCTTIKGDVLKDLASLPAESYDLVISDPPALIKSRKDIPAGTHAYLQLNTQVFRIARPLGGVVSCSCSGLLEEESFLAALTKAAYRNRRKVRWLGRGSQAPDHPMLTEFPEGRYLKAWVGICEGRP